MRGPCRSMVHCRQVLTRKLPEQVFLRRAPVGASGPELAGSWRNTAPLIAPLILGLRCPQFRSSSSSSRWVQRQAKDYLVRDAKVRGLKSRAAFKLLEIDDKYRLFKKGNVVVDLGYAPGSWSQVALDRTGRNGLVVGIDIIPAQPPKGVSTLQGNFLSPGVQDMVKQFLREHHRKRLQRHQPAAESNPTRSAEASTTDPDDTDDHIKAIAADGGKLEEMTGPSSEPADIVLDKPSYVDAERAAAAEELTSQSELKGAAKLGEPEWLVDVVLSDMLMNTSGNSFKDHAGSMDLCMAALTFASDALKPGGHFVCKFYQGSEDKAFEKKLKKMFKRVHREKPESSRQSSKEAYFVAIDRKQGVTLAELEDNRA
ncbi:hypothetical protein VTK73DRAFT_3951 [Phialemonium thermophilum]|uniref:rRNA methyltransferase 2, mitochondrial n=1 Tax=Phialemonium thermophilum TaxID=223376 RepID=A0ABR3XZI0_9PEZI